MKRSSILIIVSVVLIAAILAFTFFGCSCWAKVGPKMSMEGFADAPSKDTPVDSSAPLTPQENELFEDLKNNRLNEEDIKTLVQNNVLNEKLVEKFLDKLASSDDLDEKAEEKFEGFTSVGNTYACASFGADQ